MSQAAYHQHEDFIIRSQKRDELKSLNISVYPHTFHTDCTIEELCEKYRDEDIGHSEDALEKKTPTCQVSGRLVLMRPMGKNMFCHIQDHKERLQIMVNRDFSSFQGYEAKNEQDPKPIKLMEKKLDLGDIIGIQGHLFRTQKGELTLLANNLTLLSKSLLPLPDKHNGLADIETSYRKRWLDLISNPEVSKRFIHRSQILQEVRNTLLQRDFMEVETPVLQNTYGGANARPFKTHHHALHLDPYLRISLEIPLKKLLIGGYPRVFEMGKVFRNEGIDRTHNPEFTMMEAYAAGWDYHNMMDLVEEIFVNACKKIHNKTTIPFGEHTIDLGAPWQRLKMIDAIKKYVGIDPLEYSLKELKDFLCQNTRLEPKDLNNHSIGNCIASLFEELVEDHLIQPTHIIDHPIETTPLCKWHRDAKAKQLGLVERFETFIAGKEFCNAYSELNDPQVQRALFEEQLNARKEGDEEAHPMDEEFLEAMCQGMPPAGGLGIGIDRLCMLLTNSPSIRDVLFFPAMRPETQT